MIAFLFRLYEEPTHPLTFPTHRIHTHMSAKLLEQWQDRVAEVEAQITAIRDELQAVDEQKKRLEETRDDFARREQTAKRTLRGELQQLEAVVHSVSEANKAATQQKADTERAAAAAQAGYDELTKTVKTLQRQEKALKGREDLGAVLESESALWEQEETQMRDEIRRLEDAVDCQRKELKQAVKDKQAQLKEAEADLKTARQRRDPSEGNEEVTLEALASLAGGHASYNASRATSVASSAVSKKSGVKRTILGDATNHN
jgi:DNA repair exonuclease SbcCD ATPase subunit